MPQCQIFRDDGVSLKGTLCRIIDFFIGCSTENEYTVADFESGDSLAYSGPASIEANS